MRFKYCVATLLSGLAFCARAQQASDTTHTALKEVLIIDKRDDAFTFYKSGKLSSTEDILARMPGVNMIKRGAYGLEPSLRIYSAGQINVTIDGMKLYGACTDKMDPASIYIEPNNLDEIEVTHGAAGTSMGSTIGGGLNMTLKKPVFASGNSIMLKAAQSYTTVNNGSNTSILLQTSSKKIATNFGFVYRKADPYRDGYGKTIAFSQYEKMNFAGSISYKINRRNTVTAQYLGDIGRNIGFPALTMDVGKATAHILSAAYVYENAERFLKRSEVKVYYNKVYHSMDDTKRPVVPIHMDMPGWSETIGAYKQLFFSQGKHEIQTRVDVHKAYTRADMIMYPVNEAPMFMQTLPTNYLYNAGAFVQYKYNPDSNQFIQLNGRVDYDDQFAVKTIGSKQWEVMNEDITKPVQNVLKNASASYYKRWSRLFETTLTASYGERLPTANERYGYYLYIRLDGYDYIGNPDLKPESAWQGELKMKLNTTKVQPYVNVFYHHINHYIYPFLCTGYSAMTIGARGVKGYENIAYATLQGFETGISMKPAKRLLYLMNGRYTYAASNNGTPLPQVPPLKIQHALRYDHPWAQLQLEHDWAAAQNRINAASGELRTPQWHLLNLRVAKNIQLKRSVLQLSAACENIFDTPYREHLDWGNIARPGRNVVMSVAYAIR